jgi:hypothetical protein
LLGVFLLGMPLEGVAGRQARETPKPVRDASAALIQRHAVRPMHVRNGHRISLKHFRRKQKPDRNPLYPGGLTVKQCFISNVPSPAHQTGRYSSSVLNISAYVAVLALLCTSMLAWGQQPHISKAGAPFAANTPQQVVLGTAKLVQAYDPTSKLRLAISIKAPKMAEEEKLLKQLQDKKSPNFHKWLTPDEWNARFAPAAQDEQAVVDWVKSQGLTVTARYPNRLMVDAEGTVDAIQKAFSISINKYQVDGEVEFSNDRDPQLPSNLAGVIQYIEGLNSILRMRPASPLLKGMRGPDYSPGPVRQEGPGAHKDADRAAVKALAAKMKAEASRKQTSTSKPPVTNGFYDPSDVWSSNMYDYNALQAQGHCCNPTGNSGGTPPQTSIGLATDGDFAVSDLNGFVNQYPYLAYHYYTHYIDGTPSCCDDETTLDLEWSTATSNSEGSYLDTSSINVYETAMASYHSATSFSRC